MNTAGYEWAARVRALNEIEVAKARAAHVVRVPLSAGGHAGCVTLPGISTGEAAAKRSLEWCAERSPRPTK